MTRTRIHNLLKIGGEGGDRTHGPVARTAVFETARFGHSRTSPLGRTRLSWQGRVRANVSSLRLNGGAYPGECNFSIGFLFARRASTMGSSWFVWLIWFVLLLGITPDAVSPLCAHLVRSIYSSCTLWTIPSDRPPPRLSLFTLIPRPSTLQPIETSPVCLVCLVDLVCLVHLVTFVQPKTRQTKQTKETK